MSNRRVSHNGIPISVAAIGLACALGVVPAVANGPDFTVTILALEGQPMPNGDGTIGLPNDVSVNDNGDWIADVNVSGGSVSRALIRNGQVWAKAGDPIDPNDTIGSVANALKHMNSHGDVAWRPGLDDNHSGMYLNFTPLLLRNEISAWPGYGTGTEYTGIFRGWVTDDQQVAMIATLSEPNLGTIRAIVWLSDDGQGGVTEDVLITRFDPAPGIDPSEEVTINLVNTGASDFAISNNGDALWHTTLNNAPAATNAALYRNLDLLVRKGDSSPVGGAAYNDVGASAFRVDMNNHGHYTFFASLDGHLAGSNVLIRDVGSGHEVVALRGEIAPDLDGERLIDHFGSGAQPFITDNGDIVWYSRFSGDTTTNQGLYFNDHLLLHKGVTQIGGLTLDAVCGTTATSNGITNSLMVSPNGKYVILRNRFTNGQRAVLLIEFEDIEPKCPVFADLNCDGIVNVFDLLILLGEWGPCADCNDCPADLNNDCVVNVFDLLELLASWG